MKDVIIPQGYKTQPDHTGECYACDFNVESGEGENSSITCTHPDMRNAGCVDGDYVFIKMA